MRAGDGQQAQHDRADQYPAPSCRSLRRGWTVLAGQRRGGVAVRGDERRALPVEVGIVGRPRGEAVDVAVAHAEHRGDEHRVVDLEVGGALLARARRRRRP